MNTIKRIAKNTAISSVSEIVTKLIYFVITLYIARQLGTESLGQYSFAFAFSMIMLIVADIGLSQLLIREIARKKFLANKYVTHAFLIKLLTSSITIILTIGILNILNYPAITRSITYAMVAFIILRSFSEILFSVFRAHERMEFDSSIRILRMVLILPFFIYHLNTSLAKAVLAFPIVEIFILIISLTIGVTKFFKFRLELDIEFIKSIFQKAFPMGAAIIFSSLYFYLGSIILSKFQGDAALGIYSAAYNFSLALLFIPAMFTTAIYPLLSRYYKESDEKLHKLFKYSFKYLYIIALPIAVGALLLGNEIMTLFYGPGFLQAGLALKILSLFLLIKFINFLLGIVLYSVDKQKQRMYAQASTAIFNIILNLILIPIYGVVGAAVATIITEIFLFIAYDHFVTKNIPRLPYHQLTLKPLAAVIVMAGVVMLTKFNIFLAIITGAISYGTILLITKTFNEEDKAMLKKLR